MRPRNLFILALVVGVLLAVIYFAEDRVASTDERAAAARRLVAAAPEEIVALELEWQGSRVRFERPAQGAEPPPPAEPAVPAGPAARSWRIVEPFVHRADDAAVDRLLAALTELEALRDLDGAARQDVGLAPPRGAVTWTTSAGTGKLEVGGGVPASHDVVVAASGREAPAVTSDAFVDELSRPAGEWRSRAVVAATRERIERIALLPASASPVVLVRSGETLRLESPAPDLVDRDSADRLLSDLAALRMESFLDPPLTAVAAEALAAPAGAIDVTISGEPEPLRIEVGGEMAGGSRIFRAGGQTFASASTIAAVLARPAAEWRSRNWTRFENWRIERARVESHGGELATFELARREGEWLRDGKKVPFAAASELLSALTAARADSLVEGGAPGSPPGPATPPRLTVTLSDADGNEEVLTLLAGASDSGASGVPARTRGREVTLLLPTELVRDLERKIAAVQVAEPSPEAAPAN